MKLNAIGIVFVILAAVSDCQYSYYGQPYGEAAGSAQMPLASGSNPVAAPITQFASALGATQGPEANPAGGMPTIAPVAPTTAPGTATIQITPTSAPATIYVQPSVGTLTDQSGAVASPSPQTLLLIPLSAFTGSSIIQPATTGASSVAGLSGVSTIATIAPVPIVIGLSSAPSGSQAPITIGSAAPAGSTLTAAAASPTQSAAPEPAPSAPGPAPAAPGPAPDSTTAVSPAPGPVPAPESGAAAPIAAAPPVPAAPALAPIPAPAFPLPIGITRFELFSQRFNNFGPFAPILDCDGVPVAPLTASFLPPILPPPYPY